MSSLPVSLEATLWALAVLVGLCGSAIFSGLETGIYVLNKIRLELRAAHGHAQARRWQRLLGRPTEMLGTLLISNNAVNYMVTGGAVALFTLAGVAQVGLYTTLIVTPTLFVLGEMLPKNLFRVAAERLVYPLGRVLAAARIVCRFTGLAPLVGGFTWLVLRVWRGREGESLVEPRQRVQALLAEGHAHGALSLFQSRMASQVIRTGQTRLAGVMVPIGRVVSIPVDCTRRQLLDTLARHEFSRLPVWQGRPDHVVGVVNIYDVLYDEDLNALPATHMREPIPMAPTWDIAHALVTLQRARRMMGVVTDPQGRALGIVTVKDLVEELVGELEAW